MTTQPSRMAAVGQEAHVQAFHEHRLIRRLAAAEWLAMPDELSGFVHARSHLAAMAPERRAALEHDWNTQGSAGEPKKPRVDFA